MVMASKIQQEFIEAVKAYEGTPYGLAKKSGCSGRIITYWIKGERIPRDIEVIEKSWTDSAMS